MDRRTRLMILIVAYEAQATLASVIERLPRSLLDDYECEIVVIDDASTDTSFEVAVEYREINDHLPVTVLRNRVNQGYGGNQKVGYAYAIERGFDCVALLHGDGQYAPEELPRLVAPVASGEADAVLGSRMMPPRAALAGGMPLYKYLGNRILTTFQNLLLRTDLSEFHSGYRVYSVATLRRLRYQLNTNDFHFDTQIILQLLAAGAQLQERPIPTYYGDEISRVNGLRYALDVARATVQFAIHRLGLRQHLRYEPVDEGADRYDVKLGYASSHQWALDAVPAGASVLDLGAGPGLFARALVDKGCQVTVVDREPVTAESPGLGVIQCDLNDAFELPVATHDVIVLLDIIEHLAEPEDFLRRLRRNFGHDTKTVILTTPNIAFIIPRLALLAGQFNYGSTGILDRTHTRLFTFRTLRHLLVDAGFRIHVARGIPAPFPKAIGDGVLGRALLRANLALITVSKRLFSYQIFVVATSTPDTDFLVRDAIDHAQDRRAWH